MALAACGLIPSEEHRYQLIGVGKVASKPRHTHLSLLVMQPNAVDGYTTDRMLYVNKPFQLNAFARNAWMNPPAAMLQPLLARSVESSHYFYAVTLEPNSSKTDYRLESTLMRLQQNFLVKPSRIQLALQAVLTHVEDNRLVATQDFYVDLPCPSDTPIGGVEAANQATQRLTAQVARFVITRVARDRR